MASDHEELHAWLAPLNELPLECDGMTRVISALLTRDSIAHLVCTGFLEVNGQGRTPGHWWIELGEGWVCDWRARMWLDNAEAVPHGVCRPGPDVRYVVSDRFVLQPDPVVFEVLAGMTLDQYPSAPVQCLK